MHVVGRTALVVSALLVGVFGVPAAEAAKPTPVAKTITFAEASIALAESDGLLFVLVERSVTKGKASVTVQASIAGDDTADVDDIPTSPATASFVSGQSSAWATFALPNDNVHEDDETFTVSITSTPKGFTGTDTVEVTINEDDPAPPPPHAGTFTLEPGMKVVFGGFSIDSCNTVTAHLDRSDGPSIELGTNDGVECGDPVTPTISQTVANNTLDPITLSFSLEDESCDATYSSDHTSTGTLDDVDHALTTPAEGYHAVDIHDGGDDSCERQESDAIPALDGGELQIDIAFAADPVTTGIWRLPDDWTARFDQYAVWGCDNHIKAHLVIDGVDTHTVEGIPDSGGCYLRTDSTPATINNTGSVKLLQFVLEDVTCGVRYSSSHTSTGATSVDHARIWDVGGGDFQVGIAHAGAGCANEDVNVDPGFDGNFIPFIDVYQTSH